MKKKFLSLVVLALILFMPVMALADMKIVPEIPNTAIATDDKGDNVEKTYPIYLNVTENTDNKSVTTTTFKFTFGSAIVDARCAGANGFEGSFSSTGEHAGTCTFTSAAGSTGDKIQVGTITVVAKKNAADEDCKIDYMAEDVKGTFNKANPTTGASIPVGIIAGGFALAAGAYFVTSKKNRLYKI